MAAGRIACFAHHPDLQSPSGRLQPLRDKGGMPGAGSRGLVTAVWVRIKAGEMIGAAQGRTNPKPDHGVGRGSRTNEPGNPLDLLGRLRSRSQAVQSSLADVWLSFRASSTCLATSVSSQTTSTARRQASGQTRLKIRGDSPADEVLTN